MSQSSFSDRAPRCDLKLAHATVFRQPPRESQASAEGDILESLEPQTCASPELSLPPKRGGLWAVVANYFHPNN